MILSFYRGLGAAASPLIDLFLARRLIAGKEDALRIPERRGWPGRPRPPGRLVWIHAASVGESVSALSFLERLTQERPDLHLLMTTGTLTSAQVMARRLPPGAIHQYLPVDRPADVGRFLDHWRPDLALWVESELWPTLVLETKRRGTPMVLLNGRMSPRSFARWKRLRFAAAPLLDCFRLVLGQTEADAQRFHALGARGAHCAGNLKFAAQALPQDPEALEALEEAIRGRPVWLAASTHAGEERLAAQVHVRLKPRFPDLLTVIVPRHPTRAADIRAEAQAELGPAYGPQTILLRSQGGLPGPDTEIYLADTMGEMGLFYRLGGIVFVGGSLVPHGGQNPLEPARLDNALLFGPHMTNFGEIARGLTERGGAAQVRDVAQLSDQISRLLGNAAQRARMAEAAADFARSQERVLDAVMAELTPLLPDPLPPRAGEGS